ncbi:hypothetical protein ACXR0O_21690 [Verrucomicrobiota bacterium sgz303538]
MYIDRIDLTLPEADIATLLAAFTSAEASLEFLPSVSTPDRKRYAKLGLKNESLAKQIIEVGRANPDLIPRGINFEKIDRDLVAREQLRTLKIILERLLGRVNDAMLLTGVDIYAAALSIYHCLRRNADTASLKEVVDELKRGFARPSRKKKEQQEDAPAAGPEPVVPKSQPTRPFQGSEAERMVRSAPAPLGGQAQVAFDPKPSQPLTSLSYFPTRQLFQGVLTWSKPSIEHTYPEPIQLASGGFLVSTCG